MCSRESKDQVKRKKLKGKTTMRIYKKEERE